MGRLAAAYALVRYGARRPTTAEVRRGRGRLAAVHRALRSRTLMHLGGSDRADHLPAAGSDPRG
jgi:hypothetical protein